VVVGGVTAGGHIGPPILVIAGAGSGKTNTCNDTTLVRVVLKEKLDGCVV
jgi:hypothetical protein